MMGVLIKSWDVAWIAFMMPWLVTYKTYGMMVLKKEMRELLLMSTVTLSLYWIGIGFSKGTVSHFGNHLGYFIIGVMTFLGIVAVATMSNLIVNNYVFIPQEKQRY